MGWTGLVGPVAGVVKVRVCCWNTDDCDNRVSRGFDAADCDGTGEAHLGWVAKKETCAVHGGLA